MTITLLVTQTHNANIPLFPGLSAHHSLPEIVSLVDVEGVEHLNGKRKYDGGVLLSRDAAQCLKSMLRSVRPEAYLCSDLEVSQL